MIERYEDLTAEALAPLGFEDPAHACLLLQSMAGHDVSDTDYNAMLAVVSSALADSADPDRAAANLTRWADAVGSRRASYSLLATHPPAARILITILAASQFFADLLIQNPEYIEALINPRVRENARDPAALWHEMLLRVGIGRTPNGKRDALRRFKAPEILRIGVRDLLGAADMATVAREISDFADCCVRMAVAICMDEQGLGALKISAIAMGKLGGRELNYSSDIDLIFVHDDNEDTVAMSRLAEAVRETLAKATDAGFVFRVDLRLRPEGRFGPLSRSLESCRDYYESWAEPWERQALIKARPVAGDPEIGAQFLDMVRPFVYRPRVEESVIDSIRGNKRRLEEKIARAGEAGINVKEGIGGIRDIEFSVQLLQLVVGGLNPAVRTGNTLDALVRLADSDLISIDERDTLSESYVFLRTVEHRLQLLDERAVRSIPTDPHNLRKCARRLGYHDAPAFLKDYHRHTRRVSQIFKRLFYGEEPPPAEKAKTQGGLVEWVLAAGEPTAQKKLRKVLADHGFKDVDGALSEIRRAVLGSEYGGIRPEARAAFAAIAPQIIDYAGRTDDPDAALRGLGALADASPSRQALYEAWRDSPPMLDRFCLLAADGGYLLQILLQHPELFDLISDPAEMESPRPPSDHRLVTARSLGSAYLRERLRIGARDLWEMAALEVTLRDLTESTERTIAGALWIACAEAGYTGRFAIIGMGRLGGAELAYSSDLDLLYVADVAVLGEATRVARRFQHIVMDDMAAFGARSEIDSRLRPDGQKGALVLDMETYRKYYEETSATWEKQALLKARFVAGDQSLGDDFCAMAAGIVYAPGFSAKHEDEIRSMKRRIETERLKQASDLKLANGGLMDIEWATQMQQLRFGARNRRIRSTNSLAALKALRDEALISQVDWEILDDTYRELVEIRNHLFLKHGVAVDAPEALDEVTVKAMHAAREVCRKLIYVG